LGADASSEFARLGNMVGHLLDQRKFSGEENFSAKRQLKLVHHGPDAFRKAVNNPRKQNKRTADFIGVFALFTRSSPAPSGEQLVHINSLSDR
jgi:hypothetical protein